MPQVTQSPTDTANLDELLDETALAAFLGVAPTTPKIWRCRGGGPSFVKFGNGRRCAVRYRRRDILAWLDERTRTSTSDKGPDREAQRA